MNNADEYLFYCKTREGYVFKILFELLKNCVKSCSIKFSKEGIYITSIDTKKQLLLLINMGKHNFNIYRCSSVFNISVNLTSFYNMLKILGYYILTLYEVNSIDSTNVINYNKMV